MARLDGTAAIVTGAAQGIGATYAKALAEEVARVSVCELDPPDAEVQAICDAGGEAIGRICDVSDPKGVAALVEATEQAFGSVHVLVNNAALFGKIALKPFTEITSEEWDRVMTINTRGPFECVKVVLPVMRGPRLRQNHQYRFGHGVQRHADDAALCFVQRRRRCDDPGDGPELGEGHGYLL
jgi:NAD(P)-dependent dehydrogenase (short-subunit alcohol dehydrogenase family)